MKNYPFIFAGIVWMLAVSLCHGQWMGMEITQAIPIYGRAYSISVAQTNGDEFSDLVLLDAVDFSKVHVFRGNSDHQFEYFNSLTKDENFRFLKTGDLDGDGYDDLVISAYWNNGFRIFWGNKSGAYSPGDFYPLTGHGRNLAIADIDRDGKMDVAALSGGSGQAITLHLFFGNKTRTLSPGRVTGSYVHTDTNITIVDKNQDGLVDVMVSSSFPWFVIFYQQADGAFVPRHWPHEIEFPFTSRYYLADLNSDSKADLIAFYEEEGLRFYDGLADTLFSERHTSLNSSLFPRKVSFADLNHDGNLDIVLDDFDFEADPSPNLWYLLGNGDFTFQPAVEVNFGSPIDNYFLGDVDDDGFSDLVASCQSNQLIIARNVGIVTSIPEQPSPPVNAYPNPFLNELIINAADYPCEVTVTSLNGIPVFQARATAPLTADSSFWPAGIYVVRVESGRGVFVSKLIKH